jgi:hypothetical protein
MQDSPLSITASVTGILVFIAANLTFIYVRYNTLKNGYTEMSTILMSVKSSIEDTHMMQTTNLGDHLQELLNELYRLEKEIISEVSKASDLRPPEAVNVGVILGDVELATARFVDSLVASSPRFALLLAGTRFVLTLGQTPKLVRWYLVRNKVLKMVLQRETLRSRMLFYQMCLVHS